MRRTCGSCAPPLGYRAHAPTAVRLLGTPPLSARSWLTAEIAHPPQRTRPHPSHAPRVVNTIFTAFELVADTTIFWLPLYWEAKLLVVLWLALPSTRGASVLR